MESKIKFKVIFSKEAGELISSIPEKARRKVLYNIDKVAHGEMDKELFKKLENTDIWEFRTLYAGIAYRILAFWDTEADTLVIAANGFIKKTQKTPAGEISKAEEIRERYFRTKSNKHGIMKENKDFYTFEEIKDEFIGEVGTPARDEYEAELRAHLIGEAIKKAREGKNLTQAQLGKMIGVQRAQISKIESGKNLTLATMARVFKAMGIDAKLDMGALGRVALW